MRSEHKTKEQRIDELAELGQGTAGLEATKAELVRSEEQVRQQREELQNEKLGKENAERKQAEEALQEQTAELTRRNALIAALSQVAARLQTSFDPDQVMEILGSELKRFGLNCLVALLERNGESAVIHYISAEPSALLSIEKSIGLKLRDLRIPRLPIYAEIVEQGRAVFVPNLIPLVTAALPRLPQPVMERAFQLCGVCPDTPAFCLPLTVSGRLFGVLNIVGDELREADLSAVAVFASQVAIAIENARLYQAAQQKTAKRRRVEEALRESEAAYTELADSISDVFFAFDKDLRYTYWNTASEKLTGIPARDAIGRSLYELFPDTPQTRRAERAYRDVLRTGQSRTFVNEYQLEGQDFLFEISAYPSRGGLSVFVRDITDRKRAEEALQYRVEFERLITGISTRFIGLAPGEIDSGIDDALQAIGEFAGVDRSYVFLFGDNGTKVAKNHEWCADSIERQIQRLKDLPVDDFAWSMGMIKRFETVHIPRIADLPSEASAEKEEFQEEGIQSLIMVPIVSGGVAVGFLGFDSVRAQKTWSEDIMTLLRIVGEIFANALERQRAAEVLRETENRYRTLFDGVPVGLYRTTPDGEILDANPALVQMLGYPDLESLLALSAGDVYVDIEDRRREQALLEREAVVREFDMQVRQHDGTAIWVRDTVRAVCNADGRVLCYEGCLENITERKRAEQLLRALNQAALAMEQALTQEEIFAAVVEALKKLGFSCMVLPTDESQSRLLPKHLSYEAGALRAAERLVGLKHEEFSIPIQSVRVLRDVVRERKTVFDEDVGETLRQILPNPVKRLAGLMAGMLKVPRAITAPLVVEDKVIGVLTVASNDLSEADMPAITAFAHQMAAAWRKANLLQELQNSLEELNQTQAQLLQAQKMEAVGRLAGGVAHDFNNLLTAIMGYSQFLLAELPPDDPRRMDVEEILKAGTRAASLTGQLLAFSRRQMLLPQVLDLNALVANTEKMLQRLIGEDIELLTLLQPTLRRVKADPGQIEQVIVNLAINARDAMPQGGELTIQTENLTLDEKQCALIPEARPGQFVRLSVADTGVGMDEETLQHIFEPFFTTKEGGTGLGLSVVYGIVAQHEGWISVHSEPGQGSTFKVYLRAFSVKPESQTEEMVSLQELQGRGEGILLLEDDEQVRDYTTRVLGERGYVVFEAADVKEALDIFESEKRDIHLVFSDVVLPDGTGLQLVDQLLPGNGDLRVLMSSGYSDDRSQWTVVRERGFPFLQKPYTLPELLRVVRETIEHGG